MRLVSRILFPALAIAGAALSIAAGQALAQPYPTRPIRVVVPFPAGGPSDVLARIVGQKITESWGQQVVVDNKPGGNTVIGAQEVAKAAPDGYTLLLAIDSTLTMNQYLYSKLPYDPLKDFAPITLAAASPIILVVNPSVPARSVQELIALARSQPGKMAFGAGTVTTQLAGEMLKSMAGLDILHVPYKGSAPTTAAVLAGDVPMSFDGITSPQPHIKTNKLRALAIASARRFPTLPDVPTMAEAGVPGFEVAPWLGLVAPAGTSKDIIAKLNAEVVKIVRARETRDRITEMGMEVVGNSAEEFAAVIRSDAAKWAAPIKQAGIRFD